MVPYATLLIPLYVLLNAVGLSNSLVGVALVLTMFQLPFSMFMMRISFESIPRELDEAAMVDGCNAWRVLWTRARARGEAGPHHGRACSRSSRRGTTSSRRSSSSTTRTG